MIKLKGKSNYKTVKKQEKGDFKPIIDNYLTLMSVYSKFKPLRKGVVNQPEKACIALIIAISSNWFMQLKCPLGHSG